MVSFGSLISQALTVVGLIYLAICEEGWPEPGFLNSEMAAMLLLN